ncbi:hypothetical protein BDR05DRAFT_895410, partial [Suillus weaverae]
NILTLQEACEDHLQNTKSNRQWHTLYPIQHYTHPKQKTYTVMLISTSLNTNNWQQISLPSSNIMVIQLFGLFSKCTIFNIYNNREQPRP